MERNIFIVNATQVVTSEQNPQGLFSVVSGYPKTFDSRSFNATEANPNGDTDLALLAAKSEYHSRLSSMETVNAARVMSAVTLTMANGRQIMHDSLGKFPDMTPSPEPPVNEEEPDPYRCG